MRSCQGAASAYASGKKKLNKHNKKKNMMMYSLSRLNRFGEQADEPPNAWAIFYNGDALHLEPVGWQDEENGSKSQVAALRKRLWLEQAPKTRPITTPSSQDYALTVHSYHQHHNHSQVGNNNNNSKTKKQTKKRKQTQHHHPLLLLRPKK